MRRIEDLRAPVEISSVTERLYLKTREALAKTGYLFVVAIEPLSLGQLVGSRKTRNRFGRVNDSLVLRATVPQQMEIAINPKNLRIANSNLKSAPEQARMIQQEEEILKDKLPGKLRGLISMRVQSASVQAQLDIKYQKETGRVIFTDWYGHTDSLTGYGVAVDVGRDYPTGRLRIGDWYEERDPHVFAFPAVVLPPRKLVL